MATFDMSRSASMYETGIGRGMGCRDSNQDLLGFVHMIPSRARERILDIAATQLSDGTCLRHAEGLATGLAAFRLEMDGPADHTP